MSQQDELFDLCPCTIVAESDLAVKIALEDGETLWIPLSQIEAIHHDGSNSLITMTKWIAQKKGLC